MFCWMDSDEIRKQFYMTGVKEKDAELALGKAPTVSKFLGKIFGVDELKQNMEFVKSFKSFTAKKENCKKLFELIKRKTTIKEVFVYPENKHLDVLVNLDYVLDIDENVTSKLKPTMGDVFVIEDNKPKSERWENLNWNKNGQLIKIAGVVAPNGCFFPFEKPTNSAVSLRCCLSQNYKSGCIGAYNHFENLPHVYSLIIGKVIATSQSIKPIFFYDCESREGEGKKEMMSYLRSWYNIFKDIKSEDLYGKRIINSSEDIDKIITMISTNEYKAGEWLQTKGKMNKLEDYLGDYARRNRYWETIGKGNVAKEGSIDKRDKVMKYNIWGCENYVDTKKGKQ